MLLPLQQLLPSYVLRLLDRPLPPLQDLPLLLRKQQKPTFPAIAFFLTAGAAVRRRAAASGPVFSQKTAGTTALLFCCFVSALQELLSGDVLRLLDRPLRLRLLLACLLAPQRAVEECREELSALAKRCAEGDCEWAAFYAAAAGRFGGQLELPPSEGGWR